MKIQVSSFLILIFFSLCSFTCFGSSNSKTSNLSVNDFLEPSQLVDAEVSPNGHYLALIFNKNNTRALLIKDLTKSNWPTVGQLSDKVIRPYSVKWGNNKRLIVNLSVPYDPEDTLEEAEENTDFDITKHRTFSKSIAMDFDTTNITVLHDKHRHISRIAHYLPNDSEHILMSYYRRGRMHIDKVNILNGEALHITKGARRTFNILVDSEGNPLYRLDYLPVAHAVEVYSYIKGDWEEIDQVDFDEKVEDALSFENLHSFGLGANASLIYKQKNSSTGYVEIIKIDRKTKNKSVIASHDDMDIFGLIRDHQTNDVIGYTTLGKNLRSHYFDSDLQAQYNKLIAHLPNENISLYRPTPTSPKAVVISSGRDNPGYYDIYDFKKNTLTPLGHRYEKLTPQTLALPAKVNIKSRDGVFIENYILFPPQYDKSKPYPMIALPHGGPQSRDYYNYDQFAQFLATRGYIVLQPNFRGSTGYGKNFEEAGYKQWGMLMQNDITDSVQFMIKQGIADPKRICIVGASYGGYAAIMGTIKTPNLFRCAVSLNGVTHLRKQIKHDLVNASLRYRKKIRESLYKTIGDPSSDSEILDENSPLIHSEKISAPLFLIAGTADEVVPYSQTRELHKKLIALKKPVKLLKLKNTPHNIFYYKEDRESIYSEVEQFLAKHLE